MESTNQKQAVDERGFCCEGPTIFGYGAGKPIVDQELASKGLTAGSAMHCEAKGYKQALRDVLEDIEEQSKDHEDDWGNPLLFPEELIAKIRARLDKAN